MADLTLERLAEICDLNGQRLVLHRDALKVLEQITKAQTKQIARLQHQITELEITQRMLVEAQR